MAGVKGRSGGSNRLSPAERHVRGSYRRDRHAPPAEPPTAAAQARYDDLTTAYREAVNRWSSLTEELAAADEVTTLHADYHRRLREQRQQAALMSALSATLERMERQMPAPAAGGGRWAGLIADTGDPFAEFES